MERNFSKIIQISPISNFAGSLDVLPLEVGYAEKKITWNARPFMSDPYFRIYLLKSGVGTLQTMNGVIPLKAGYLYLIPAHFYFRYIMDQAPPSHYWIHFTSHSLEFHPGFEEILETPATETARQTFQTLVDNAKHKVNPLLMDLSFRELIYCFLKEERLNENMKLSDPNNMYKALMFIHQNIDGKLPVGKIAAFIKMSQDTFSRSFKKKFGQSPSEYIIRTRVNKAKCLLIQSPMTVKEVAKMVGYDDEFFFFRVFRKYTGMTPSNYRKLNNFLRVAQF